MYSPLEYTLSESRLQMIALERDIPVFFKRS
jgi:hypothetical protein